MLVLSGINDFKEAIFISLPSLKVFLFHNVLPLRQLFSDVQRSTGTLSLTRSSLLLTCLPPEPIPLPLAWLDMISVGLLASFL